MDAAHFRPHSVFFSYIHLRRRKEKKNKKREKKTKKKILGPKRHAKRRGRRMGRWRRGEHHLPAFPLFLLPLHHHHHRRRHLLFLLLVSLSLCSVFAPRSLLPANHFRTLYRVSSMLISPFFVLFLRFVFLVVSLIRSSVSCVLVELRSNNVSTNGITETIQNEKAAASHWSSRNVPEITKNWTARPPPPSSSVYPLPFSHKKKGNSRKLLERS